jgi:hypothetical protein
VPCICAGCRSADVTAATAEELEGGHAKRGDTEEKVGQRERGFARAAQRRREGETLQLLGHRVDDGLVSVAEAYDEDAREPVNVGRPSNVGEADSFPESNTILGELLHLHEAEEERRDDVCDRMRERSFSWPDGRP